MGKETDQIKSGCGGLISTSSALQQKKEQSGEKEKEKDISSAEMKTIDETKIRGDQECDCHSTLTSSSFKNKEEGKCSPIKSNNSSSVKSTRSSSSSTKGSKCDSSYEAFKTGSKESGEREEKDTKELNDLEGKGDSQCNISYVEFLKGRKENKGLYSADKSSTDNKCQDSYGKMSKSENIGEDCIELLEHTEPSLTNGPGQQRPKGTSTKGSDVCKEYLKHSLHSENNIAGERFDSNGKNVGDFLAKKHPTPPIVEAGASKVQKLPPNICPGIGAQQDITGFFPLDARNKDLHECIAKNKTDPSEVIKKCSLYADKSDECTEAAKKIHKDRRSGIISTLGQSRRRQLLRRWSPSAAIYLAATTALTVWVTEWKEPIQVMKQVLGLIQPRDSNE